MVGTCFCEKPYAKTQLSISILQNDKLQAKNTLSTFKSDFRFLVGTCFCEKPFAKTPLSIFRAIRPFIMFNSVDSKSRFQKFSAPVGKPPGKQPCTGAPFPNGSSATGKTPRVAPQLASRLQHVDQVSGECPLQCTS